MFFDELTPVVKELTGYPVAFLGGFFSGLLRLNLGEDPVKSWLNQQAGVAPAPSSALGSNGKSNGPQTISIE